MVTRTVGYGLGKANEVTAAIAKGTEDAKKNLVKVPVINSTIPHEQEVSFGGAKVFMKESLRGIMGYDFTQEFPW